MHLINMHLTTDDYASRNIANLYSLPFYIVAETVYP